MTQHVFRFEDGTSQVPFVARLVTKGMGFGRWDREARSWVLRREDARPVVEFYDARSHMTPYGQFVSRYLLETLAEGREGDRPRVGGLMLDTGSPDWQIGGQELGTVIEKLSPVARDHLEQQARGLVLLLSNRGNPDHAQDPTFPIFGSPDDMSIPVSDLNEASVLSRLYIEAFDLGGGNWTGGAVSDGQGRVVARVAYNGRVFDAGGELIQEAADAQEYRRFDAEWFSEQGPSVSVVDEGQIRRTQRNAG